MPVLNSVKRRMVEHLASLVNELHLGSDGTIATEDDGGARTLSSVTPTVRIIQEVYLQYKDGTTGEFIPVYRTSLPPFSKSAQNEVQFSFILEVD